MSVIDWVKVSLMFVNAFCGVFAAYPGPEVPPMARLVAAALVAGCGAVLLFLKPLGAAEFSPEQVGHLADELERRREERVQARLRGEPPPVPPSSFGTRV